MQSVSSVVSVLQLVFASFGTLLRFFWYSEKIAKHPLITIQLCIVFVSVCSVGFL